MQFFTYDRKRGVSYVGHNRVIVSDGSCVILKAHSQLAMETFPWSYGAEQMSTVAKCTVHLVLINMRADCAGCWADWYDDGYRGIREWLMRLRSIEIAAWWDLEWAFLLDFVNDAASAGLFQPSSADSMRAFLSHIHDERHRWSLAWMPGRTGGLNHFSNNFVECIFAMWKRARDLSYGSGG